MKILVYDRLISLNDMLVEVGIKRTSVYSLINILKPINVFLNVTKYFDFLLTSDMLKYELSEPSQHYYIAAYKRPKIDLIKKHLKPYQLIAIKNYNENFLRIRKAFRFTHAVSYKRLKRKLLECTFGTPLIKRAYDLLQTSEFEIFDKDIQSLYIDIDELLRNGETGIKDKIDRELLHSKLSVKSISDRPIRNDRTIDDFVAKVKEDFNITQQKVKRMLITIEFDDKEGD